MIQKEYAIELTEEQEKIVTWNTKVYLFVCNIYLSTLVNQYHLIEPMQFYKKIMKEFKEDIKYQKICEADKYVIQAAIKRGYFILRRKYDSNIYQITPEQACYPVFETFDDMGLDNIFLGELGIVKFRWGVPPNGSKYGSVIKKDNKYFLSCSEPETKTVSRVDADGVYHEIQVPFRRIIMDAEAEIDIYNVRKTDRFKDFTKEDLYNVVSL